MYLLRMVGCEAVEQATLRNVAGMSRTVKEKMQGMPDTQI